MLLLKSFFCDFIINFHYFFEFSLRIFFISKGINQGKIFVGNSFDYNSDNAAY